MTPEMLQKVTEARERYLALPEANRSDFLEQLRTDNAEVAARLETLLGQQQVPKPVDLDPPQRKPDTVDYVNQPDSAGDRRTADYHESETDAGFPVAIGRYRINAKLGEGGMGVVYRGRDSDLNRFLAVKVMKEGRQNDVNLCRRFVEEAQIMGQLQHPSIAPIHEIGKLGDGRPFFSMKQIQGKTLAGLLKERQKPAADLPRFVSIFGQVCQTLAYAHSEGIIHRDLKPHNIMVGAFSEVQVMDWGLAKNIRSQESGIRRQVYSEPRALSTGAGEPGALAPGASEPGALATGVDPHNTRAGAVIGTPAYMAPEQARGEIHALDERADVFGLGAILCEILTGSPAFRGRSGKEVAAKAAQGNLQDAYDRLERCGADQELVDLAKRSLARDRDGRPDNGAEVAAAVERYEEQVQERLRQAELARAAAQAKAQEEAQRLQAEKVKRRVTVALAVVGLILVTVIGGGLAWYRQDRIRLDGEAKLREANEDFKLRDIAKGIRQAIDEAQKLRQVLRAKLRKEGGVRHMYNESAGWKGEIELAGAAVRRADTLAKKAGEQVHKFDGGLASTISELKRDLQHDREDYQIVIELNRIRDKSLGTVNGTIDRGAVLQKYPEVFRKSGFNVLKDDPNELATRIHQSVIGEQLVASLDDWAGQALLSRTHKKHFPRVLKIARLADHDPTRKRLRDVRLWKQEREREKFARVYLQQPSVMKKLPPQTLVMMANLLSDLRKREEWERKAQMMHPTDFELAFFLANTLLEAEKYSESEGYYRTALARQPENAAVWNNIGIALSSQKKFDEAIAAYTNSLTIDNNDKDTWTNLGLAFGKQKKLNKAVWAFTKALAIDRQFKRTWYEFAGVLARHKKFDKAIEAYTEVLKIDPKDSEAWIGVGNGWANLKKFDAAMESFQKALLFEKKNKVAWTNLGNARAGLKKFEEAIQAYDKALKIDPGYKNAWFNKGLAFYYLKDLDKAVAAYDEALKIDAKYKSAWLNLGTALLFQKKVSQGIKAFQKARELDPQNPVVWSNLGSALHSQKEFKEAVKAFQKALELDPKRHKAHFGLGLALRASGRFEKAAASFQQVIHLLAQGHPNQRVTQRELQLCRRLLSLEKQLPAVLRGERTVSINDHLGIIVVCVRYKREYRDAVKLYVELFAREPKLAQDVNAQHRYNAARTAALAASNKGSHAKEIDGNQRTSLRQQSLSWLQADLKTYQRVLKKNRLNSAVIFDRMQRWLNDPDFENARDEQAIAKLPKGEQQAWKELWADVQALGKAARSRYTEITLKGSLTDQTKEQTHTHKMAAGTPYVIDMQSQQFDTYLRLEDSKGSKLAENDDINASAKNLNSRIVFISKTTGVYRIIATSFQNQGRGAYKVLVREFR